MSNVGAGKKAWVTRRANKIAVSQALNTPESFIEAFYKNPDSVSSELTQNQIRWAREHAENGLFAFCISTGFKYNSLEAIENSTDRLWLAEESMSPKDLLREFSFHTFERVFPFCQDSYEALIHIVGKGEIDRYLKNECVRWRYRWLRGDTPGVLEELVKRGLYDFELSGKQFTPPDVVREIVNAIPESAWHTGRVFDASCGSGTFLLEAQNKLNNINYLTDEQVLDRLCGFDVCRRRAYITAALLDPERCNRPCIYVADTLKELQSRKDLMLRFGDSLGETVDTDDLIIMGNPPFQDKEGMKDTTTSKNLAARFMTMLVKLDADHLAMVLPVEWAGPNSSKLKEMLFNDAGMRGFVALGRTRFPGIQKSTCYVVCQSGYRGKTLVRDTQGKEQELDLTKAEFIPNDLDQIRVLDRIKEAGEFTSIGYRYGRGNMANSGLIEVDKLDPNAVEFIKGMGGKGPMKTVFIDRDSESSGGKSKKAGFGVNKVVMCQLGDTAPGTKVPRGFGALKVAKASQVVGHNVVYMGTKSSAEKPENMKTYLETKFVRFLQGAARMTTSNSKNLFDCVPDVDFSVEWTDEKLYSHFKLTEYEIHAIESTTGEL